MCSQAHKEGVTINYLYSVIISSRGHPFPIRAKAETPNCFCVTLKWGKQTLFWLLSFNPIQYNKPKTSKCLKSSQLAEHNTVLKTLQPATLNVCNLSHLVIYSISLSMVNTDLASLIRIISKLQIYIWSDRSAVTLSPWFLHEINIQQVLQVEKGLKSRTTPVQW